MCTVPLSATLPVVKRKTARRRRVAPRAATALGAGRRLAAAGGGPGPPWRCLVQALVGNWRRAWGPGGGTVAGVAHSAAHCDWPRTPGRVLQRHGGLTAVKKKERRRVDRRRPVHYVGGWVSWSHDLCPFRAK